MATKDQEIVVPDEGELAADYLENLLDIADLDGDIEIEVKTGANLCDRGLGRHQRP
jgi:hypothetical protein